MLRPQFLGASLLIACSLSATVEASTFNGKAMALSDAGLATANYLEGMSLNPAALAQFKNNDDFSINLNAGAVGSDENDLLDKAEALSDTLDRIGDRVTADDAPVLIDQLEAIDNSRITGEAGGGLYVNVPTRWASVGLHARTELSVIGVTDVAEADLVLLRQVAQNEIPVDADVLQSRVEARGAAVSEGGLTLARSEGDAAYGVTLKYQRVDLIDYTARVHDYDEADFDADEYRTKSSNFNVDVGFQHQYGKWRVGAVARNLLKQEYTYRDGRAVKIEPQLAVGGGYRNDWFTASLDVDANGAERLVTGEDSQFARAGVEFNAWGWAQLRLGYRSDLKSEVDDTYSVGLGFTPFGVVNLDLAAVKGDNDTIGAALQFGFSF